RGEGSGARPMFAAATCLILPRAKSPPHPASREDLRMKRLLVTALLSTALALPAYAALKDGDKAPDFSAKASLAGKEFNFSLKDALKKGPVVVYFYPSAFTGGCNAEAHAFSESKEKFDAAGATIIGVSRDNIERLNAFSS